MPRFDLLLIKPTRYDDDGYPVQWRRSTIPSNSLASVAALAQDAYGRKVLGADVDLVIEPIDETNAFVDPDAIIARSRRGDAKIMVMLVGVQSNQYPRAMDIARPLRAANIPVCIGGFHVSGCVSMLGESAKELDLARDLGVSLFAGEAEEGRLDEVIVDGYFDRLKPLYNHLADMPGLSGAPAPILSKEVVARSMRNWSSFDLGRGCPFECSFCTIINVQGRKSRYRDVADLERIIRQNHANGVTRFFVTDDNLARNKNWEAYADKLIAMRREEGVELQLIIQVDTLAHRIPRFIDKIYEAGANIIFIGLENINPDNLEAVKKRQNRIEEYREMFMAWKKHGVVLVCGYIVGFPNDTKDSILRDVDYIKRELPVDMLYLNFLTPLPGSEDHRKMARAGRWMDPDFNKYDLNHAVVHHERMSDDDWREAYWEAHRRFYSFEHTRRVFDRMVQLGHRRPRLTLFNLLIYREGPRLERVAFSEFGIRRITRRTQRRHGLPLESPLVFYPRLWAKNVWKTACYVRTYAVLRAQLWRAEKLYRDRPTVIVDPAILPAGAGRDTLVVETEARSTAATRRRIEKRAEAAGALGN